MACNGTNRHGKPCRAAPTKGTDYCRAHDPNVPEADRFGSPEQSAIAGGSAKPHVPKPIEAMRARVEAEVDALLAPYFDAAKEAMLHGTAQGRGEVVMSPYPDLEARQRAVERILDRVYGRPRQSQEITGPGGGPIQTSDVDPSKLTDDELETLRVIARRAAER